MANDARVAPTRLISLVKRALRTDDAVVKGDDGGSWQVHRNPQPGVTIALTEIDDGKPTGATVCEFSAAQQRHLAYPAGIPFVADLPGNCHGLLIVLDGFIRLSQIGVGDPQVSQSVTFVSPVADLPSDAQRLLVVFDRLFRLPQAIVGDSQISESVAFESSIADLPGDG